MPSKKNTFKLQRRAAHKEPALSPWLLKAHVLGMLTRWLRWSTSPKPLPNQGRTLQLAPPFSSKSWGWQFVLFGLVPPCGVAARELLVDTSHRGSHLLSCSDPRLVAVVARFCVFPGWCLFSLSGSATQLLAPAHNGTCLAWSVLAWLFPLCLSSIYGGVRIDSHMSGAALSFPHLPIRGGLSFAEFMTLMRTSWSFI